MLSLLLLSIISCSLLQVNTFNVEDCPPGHYCTARAITPIPCPPGTWSNAGAAKCEACPIGYYSTKGGASYCTKCEQGHFCESADLSPQPCPLGLYNDKLGRMKAFIGSGKLKYKV